MLGWINDCTEKLVIEKFGLEAWHTVKKLAGCDVKDGEFMKLEHYTDKSTIDLVKAASQVSGLTVDQVLEAFGEYFVPYIIGEGYENLLCCQGSTFKDWMTNINEIHQHLQVTFPKKMIMPEFWCEEQRDGSITLYYLSKRGNLLAPLAKGLVAEIARYQFGLDIDMQRLTTQAVDGARFTSWRIVTQNPADLPKLKLKKGGRDGQMNTPTQFKCPFSGEEFFLSRSSSSAEETTETTTTAPPGCPYHHQEKVAKSPTSVRFVNNLLEDKEEESYEGEKRLSLPGQSSHSYESETISTNFDDDDESMNCCGLSPSVTKKVIPYHIVLNEDFQIIQVGQDLPRVLKASEATLVGLPIDEVFEFTKPLTAKWTHSWLRKLEDQPIVLTPVGPMEGSVEMRFKGSAVRICKFPLETMIILCPDAKNLEELREMDLTLSDLPVHGAHRDAVFLREHLSHQMNNALQMEKLSKTLQKEKSLLESLLPFHAAEGLRNGKAVEPRFHNNVTLFFSDIVGFTRVCDQIKPYDVIEMLNRLYCIMDFLCVKFKLFKIETIGDAYVCCSGLPAADVNHARNVANFAIAVTHCCRQVLSPIDGNPIELRIGIHTGSCASGVVGVTNPRYCVFGDTVNTAARHESTGFAGKIHCSSTTAGELKCNTSHMFDLQVRGLVDMKGKGQLQTYWLQASGGNELVNAQALEKLDAEVKDRLIELNYKDPLEEKVDGNETFDMLMKKKSYLTWIRSQEIDQQLAPNQYMI